MKYLITMMLLVIFVRTGSAQQNYRDVVYLKNGSVIKGIIVEQTPNVSIKIQTKDGSVFVYEIKDVEKMAKEKMPNEFTADEKSPTTAFLYSFLVPGLGQHYNGESTKGFIQEGFYLGGMLFGIIRTTDNTLNSKQKSAGTIGFLIAFSASLWSMIDAPISANNINDEIKKERANSYGHLFEYNFDNKAVAGIDPAYFQKGSGVSLTIHF